MKEAVLELAFSGGIDQSRRAEIVDPRASFVALENMRGRTIGAAEKRQGFDVHTGTDVVNGSARTSGARMFPDGKKTCVVTGEELHVYSPGEEVQVSRGRVPEAGLSLMKVPAPPGQSSIAVTDSLLVGAYLVLVGTSVGQATVYACVVEAETGQVILPYTAVVVGSAGEIVGLLAKRGSTAVLFVAEGSNGDIMMSELDCDDATTILSGWSTAAAAVSNADGFLRFATASAGARCYLAYVNDSGGTSQVSVEMFDGSTGGSTTINTSSVTPGAVAAGATSGDTLWVAWNETTSVKVKGLDTANLSTVPATTSTVVTTANAITTGLSGMSVVPSTTGAGRLFVNDGAVGRLFMRNFVTTTGAVATSGSTVTAFNVVMSGQPFRIGSRFYGVCRGYESNGDLTLCDLTDTDAWVRPVANLPPRLSYGFPIARAVSPSATQAWFPILVQTAGSVYSGFMAKFDFAASYRWRPVTHNGVTFLSGGLVSFFDGLRVMESNFVVRPPAPSLSATGTGMTGTFNVVVTYDHVDAAGNWHVGAVSTPTSTGAITNKTVVVAIRPLGISSRIGSTTEPTVRNSVFMTQNGGAPPYLYVGSISNKLTAETQTLSIAAAPDGSERQLYAPNLPSVNGDVRERRAPRGMDHLCSYNGMLIGALGEVLYWSGQDIDGEGTWWNEAFQVPLPGGGDVTALDCQDGTAFAWKRERIFAVSGQAPNDNGTEGGLGTPQRLAVDVGARLPFTCVTSLGIFFVSDRGIELLNRARQVEFIGAQIQDTFDAFPNVRSMTYDPHSACVLIEAADVTGSTGRAFVFDTTARVWRSFDRRSVFATANVPAQDGCMVWDGSEYRYAWLRSDGASYVESTEHKLDPGDVRVRMYAKTSWIHLGGIQGEQIADTLLLLGESVEDHDLTIGVANDYSETFASETIDSDKLAALSVYSIERDIAQKTGQAIQIEIQDATPTGTVHDDAGGGDAAKWVALTINGAVKSGVKRASSAERGG